MLVNSKLNPQQEKAVTVGRTHTLVLAGAGSGKTLTIIQRISYLLDQGVDPRRFLVLTFTRRAAKELIDRLQRSHPDKAAAIQAGTFHRFCLWGIRSHPNFFESLSTAIVIDRDDQVGLMKICRNEILNRSASATQSSNNTPRLELPKSNRLVEILSYARSTNIEFELYLERFHVGHSPQEKQAIIDTLHAYRRKKQERSYLDFDDILIHFSQSLRNNVQLSEHFKKLYDYILIDEMQDTNIIQWRILASLADPAVLYCVGDDAQNIYSFRGANLDNMRQFTSVMNNAQQLKLTINYRSTQNILNLANHVLLQSSWPYNKELKAVRPEGTKPILKDFYGADQEAEWIVHDIKSKTSAGQMDFSDIMILTRSAWSARTLEAIFIENRLPYRFIGGASLLNAAHVKDIIAACRAALNYQDDIAWLRWLSLFAGIGAKTALIHSDAVKALSDRKAILNHFQKELPQHVLIPVCLELMWQEQNNPSALLDKLTALLTPIVSKLYDRWESRQKDWNLIVRLAKRFKSIASFIESYTLDPVTNSAANLSQTDKALNLITIHSAKGLEAKVCYIIQAQRGNFPHSRSTTKEEIEEERRVFYVAITRAKDELIITRFLDPRRHFFSADVLPYFLEGLEKNTALVNYQKPESSLYKKLTFGF